MQEISLKSINFYKITSVKVPKVIDLNDAKQCLILTTAGNPKASNELAYTLGELVCIDAGSKKPKLRFDLPDEGDSLVSLMGEEDVILKGDLSQALQFLQARGFISPDDYALIQQSFSSRGEDTRLSDEEINNQENTPLLQSSFFKKSVNRSSNIPASRSIGSAAIFAK